MFMKGFAPSFVFGAQMAKPHILPTRHLHSVMMDRVWLSLIRWGKHTHPTLWTMRLLFIFTCKHLQFRHGYF